MGCAAALALAERGANVVLLERAVPGAEASSAAAGILGAQMEAQVCAAAYFPDEAQVDPPSLLRALVAATARAPESGRGSVTTRAGTTVARLLVEGDRCAGALLEGGEAIGAEATVLAAGSWSSLIP